MDNDLLAIAQQIEERKIKEQEKAVAVVEEKPEKQDVLVRNVTEATEFTKTLDEAKIHTVKEAAATDEKFVKDFTENVKQSALTSAQVEQEKQQLEKQNVQYAREKLATQQMQNAKEQQVNEWDRKRQRRQFHYDGVKPIMEFVGIKTPMWLPLLYFLTVIILPFYLIAKLFKATFGALLAGAADDDRPKAVKGFLWTVLGLTVAFIVTVGILAVLQWLGYIQI